MKRYLISVMIMIMVVAVGEGRSQEKYRVSAPVDLNIRKEASLSSDIIGVYHNGQDVDVVAIQEQWAKVNDNGSTGYVLLIYLQHVVDGGQSQPEQIDRKNTQYAEIPEEQGHLLLPVEESMDSIPPSVNEKVERTGTEKEWRKRYLNFGFPNVILSQEGKPGLKSYYGASFAFGRTFFLHRPIDEILRFGIDATWLDINYTNYFIKHITYWDTEEYMYHQGELSMHVGPSVTVEPVRKLAVHAYFQFAPSLALLYTADDTSVYANYASLWITGGSLSYGAFGLGMEARFGKTQYQPVWDSENETIGASLSGFRVYLTIKL